MKLDSPKQILSIFLFRREHAEKQSHSTSHIENIKSISQLSSERYTTKSV